MTVTVQDVMRQMRNYFIASTLTGTFTVADGIIDLDLEAYGAACAGLLVLDIPG